MTEKSPHAGSGAQLTHADLRRLFLRSFFLQSSFSFERMQAVGLTWMFIPLIKKLYQAAEDRAEALKRHLVFYNTNPLTGSILTGMIAAMEEKYAKGDLKDPSTINALKGSLIGPLAGIGDSFFLLVFVALLGIAVDFSMQGRATGVILLTIVFAVIWYLGLYLGVTQGYSRGEALLERLTGKESEAFMGGLGLVGAMVVGALVAGYVKVSTPFADGALQGQLDGLLPGLLPLAIVWLAYRLLKVGWRSVWVMILILAIGMLGGHAGLLASAGP
jgi:mannose/fructose/N-acetylgalactosamine-specific phosphotransferase system component IID